MFLFCFSEVEQGLRRRGGRGYLKIHEIPQVELDWPAAVTSAKAQRQRTLFVPKQG